MTYMFDHVVHFTNEPEKLATKLAEQGIYTIEGGRHESLGTYNLLSYFDLSYIEILSAFDKNLTTHTPKEMYSLWTTLTNEHFRDGTSRIALRTNNIEKDAERFRKLGLIVEGPIPFERKRPDGSLLTWKLLFIGMENTNLPLPFLIQWDDSDDERLSQLKKQGAINQHPLGKTILTSVGVAVQKRDPLIDKWQQIFQCEKGEIELDVQLKATKQDLILPGGNIGFYEPTREGTVQRILDQQGEKPFLIELQYETGDVPLRSDNRLWHKDIELHNMIYRFVQK